MKKLPIYTLGLAVAFSSLGVATVQAEKPATEAKAAELKPGKPVHIKDMVGTVKEKGNKLLFVGEDNVEYSVLKKYIDKVKPFVGKKVKVTGMTKIAKNKNGSPSPRLVNVKTIEEVK